MMRPSIFWLAVAGLLGACESGIRAPESAPGGARPDRAAMLDLMFVANAEDGTVSVIDAQALQVLRTYDVLPDGPSAAVTEDPEQALIGQRLTEAAGGDNFAQDLDLSPDGRVLYVSRGHRGDVAAFDLASGEMLWKQAIAGLRADHMTLSKDGATLFVSALTDDTVQLLDVTSGAVLDAYVTGQWPHDNHVSPDGARLYNASIGNVIVPIEAREALVIAGQTPYQITVFDLASGQRLQAFDFTAGIRPFALSHDETRLYAQLSEWSGVIEFDLTTGTISRELALPVAEGTSEEDYDFEAPHHGLALSRDDSRLCLAGRISDYAAIVEVSSMSLLATIPTGDAPSWATNSPDERYCFIANNRDASVSVIDYATLAEIARIPVGDGPKFIDAARIERTVICPAELCSP